MNPFEMVVLIVAICVFGSIFRARCRTGAAGPAPAADDRETRELRAEVQALKARVATLERIATDGSNALDREIEALRDRT